MKKLFSRLIGIVLSFVMLPCGPVYSLPVITGSGADVTVAQDAGTMTITTGDKSIIDYSSFDIGSAESVTFAQPSASSVALNRVTGASRSVIDGSLLANGRIFLVNPNGVLIGTSGVVNAAGFVASSLAISDSDFMSGNYSFTDGASGAGVHNMGLILVGQGGYVGLIGREVVNDGKIDASRGRVIMASGDAVSVDFDGDGLMSYSVSGEIEGALVRNTGLIAAGGGDVLLTASAAADIASSVVNNTGVIEAMSVVDAAGTIRLVAPGAGVFNSGEITTAGRNGAAGGSVEISAGAITNAGVINVSGSEGVAGGAVSLSAGDISGEGEIIADEVVEGEEPAAEGSGSGPAAGEEEVAAEAVGSVVNTGEIQAAGGQALIESAGDVINEGLINVEDGLLDIDAGGEIDNMGAIEGAGADVTLEAEGAVNSFGTLRAGTLDEQGAAFNIGGVMEVGIAHAENADGAMTFAANTDISGLYADVDDIIINDSVVLTMTGDVVLYADYGTLQDGVAIPSPLTPGAQDGTGAITMGAGSSIAGGGHDLSLYASETSVLYDITGVNDILFSEAKAASNPEFSMYGAMTVTNNLTINQAANDGDDNTHTVLSVGGQTLTVGGNITNNDRINMWGGQIDLAGDFTLAGLIYAGAPGGDTAEIFVGGNWGETWWFGAETSTVYFDGGGTSTVNCAGLSSAFNNIIVQNSTTLRTVTNPLYAANITLNDASGSTFDNATNDLALTVSDTVYVGDGCTYATGTGVNTIATLVNNDGGTVTCEGVGSSAANMVVTTMTNYNGSTWQYTNSVSGTDLLPGTYYDVVLNDGGNSRTFTMLDGDITVNNDLTITSGTLQIASANLDVNGNLINNDALGIADGTLDIGGNFTVGTFTCFSNASISVDGNWNGSAAGFTCGTSTVNFNGGGTSTLISGGNNFRNLVVGNGTTLQALTNSIGLTGQLVTTGAGSKLDMATNNLQLLANELVVGAGTTYLTGTAAQLVGALVNNGTVECAGAGFDGTNLQFTGFTNNAGSTMYFTAQAGTAYVSPSFDYANLWFNDTPGGGATYEFNAGAVDVTGDFKNMGGTVEVGDNTLNVAGNFINNDTVVFNSGILDVEGNMDDFGIVTSNAATRIYVGGNIADIYWFNPGTSTITFDGGGTSTLSSGTTDAFDFYNLVIGAGTTLQLLTNAATANFTKTGTLNQNGFVLYVAGSAYDPNAGGGTTGGTSSSSSTTTTTTPTTPVFPPSTTPAGGTDWSPLAGSGPGQPSGGAGFGVSGNGPGAGNGTGDGNLGGNPGLNPIGSRNLLAPQSHFVVIEDFVSPVGESPFGEFEDGGDEEE